MAGGDPPASGPARLHGGAGGAARHRDAAASPLARRCGRGGLCDSGRAVWGRSRDGQFEVRGVRREARGAPTASPSPRPAVPSTPGLLDFHDLSERPAAFTPPAGARAGPGDHRGHRRARARCSWSGPPWASARWCQSRYPGPPHTDRLRPGQQRGRRAGRRPAAAPGRPSGRLHRGRGLLRSRTQRPTPLSTSVPREKAGVNLRTGRGARLSLGRDRGGGRLPAGHRSHGRDAGTRGEWARRINDAGARGVPVMAVDVPSGVDATTGSNGRRHGGGRRHRHLPRGQERAGVPAGLGGRRRGRGVGHRTPRLPRARARPVGGDAATM